jgi:glycyl-tRNA synthetase beta chain
MLAAHIAEAIEASADTVEHARRAGYLCKADLMTQMVYEFPDLQGVMGREYAKKAGEADAVARAIDEQYLPKGADGKTPQTDAGACVALAEKLDALVGCFGVGLVPTSAADPYALRRAALGCIRILQDRGYSVSLPTLVQLALDTYDALDAGKLKDAGELKAEVLEFMGTRLKHQLAADHPADVVDAVIAVGLDDVLSITDRVEALGKLTSEDDFLPLAQGFKRVVNILRKQAADVDSEQAVNTGLLQEAGEVALHDAAQKAGVEVQSAVEARDWDAACRTLIGLKAPVDTFFDDVMVMVDDEALKANRIALLFQLEKLFMNVADISQISAR